MGSRNTTGMELVRQIEETRKTLLEEMEAWCHRQPKALIVATRIPVELYASVYEGAPRRFLQGVAIAGISPEVVEAWLVTLSPNSKAQRFFQAWQGYYEPWPDSLAADTVLLAGPKSLRFRDRSLALSDLRIGELLKVHHFITVICGDQTALLDHYHRQASTPKQSQTQPRKRTRLGKILNYRRWLSLLYIGRLRHSH